MSSSGVQDISDNFSLHAQALLDQIQVDLMAQTHAILEGSLVVRFSSLCLNVLLDSVDLRLILNQLLLDVI